jgi:hypothetical protein
MYEFLLYARCVTICPAVHKCQFWRGRGRGRERTVACRLFWFARWFLSRLWFTRWEIVETTMVCNTRNFLECVVAVP